MFQARFAGPVVIAVMLASVPAQARLGTRSLLEPRPDGPLSAGALTQRGHARGWLLAQAERYDVIKTKDGKVHIGKILRETAKGYLFSEGDGSTAVIDFEQISTISNTGDASPPRPPPPPQPPQQQLEAPPPPPPPAGQADTAHVYELQRERAELEADSPSIGGPIAMLIIGVPLIIGGYALNLVAGSSADAVKIALTIFGWAGVIVGTVLIIVGTIKLIVNIVRRGTRSARMNAIDDELERLRHVASPRETPYFADGPSPQWLVAEF